MSKIKIQDDSGDKKYFTIIPNYILNHSTLWDREVYIQMKRITGEDGTCWTSQNTLSKQCGICINRLKKSLEYLVKNQWIKQIGKKEISTKGGIQEVNEYRVADLWKLNIDFYENNKGVSPDDIPLSKGVSSKQQRGVIKVVKGVSPDDDKEEPIKEEPLKNIYTSFENFWSIYPKKVGKGNTEQLWKNLSLEVKEKILDDIPRRKSDDKWLNGFIKDPERYIKSRQWEDEILVAKVKKSGTLQTNTSKYENL